MIARTCPRLASRLGLWLFLGAATAAAQPAPSSAPPVALPATGDPVPPAAAAPPEAPAEEAKVPFAYADFTWQNGQSRQKDFPLQLSKYVVLSLYLDVHYAFSFNRPKDHTLTGSASAGRHNEFQLNLASVGLDWNYKNVIGRLSFQYGTELNIVQDLDGSVARGRTLTTQNLRYIRESTLGYHFDVDHGLNVEAGIFMSYIGLESYLLAENWNYHRSMVCEFTPFYFQGMRVQYFPRRNLKIEPWLMNGFQTYGKWNEAPSAGFATRWTPTEWLGLTLNTYVGTDTRGDPDRVRFHSDHSVLVRYLDAPGSTISKAAFSINNHLGFESGGKGPDASRAHMIGTSVTHRLWFSHDHLALSVRGEYVSNPSRYMAQFPPPGLASGNGEPLKIYGVTSTFEVAPTDFFMVRFETVYRRSDQPFFAGRGGTTSPDGFQGTDLAGFTPDTRKEQLLAIVGANFRL